MIRFSLQPLNYYFLGTSERIINKTHHTTLESLKASKVPVLADMTAGPGVHSRGRYLSRIQHVVNAEGGFIA